MADDTNWRTKAARLRERFGDELLSRGEFEAALADLLGDAGSPFSHVHVTIQRPEPLGTIELGVRGNGEHNNRYTLEMPVEGFSATLDVWAVPGSATDPNATRITEKAIESYLAMTRRTNPTTHLIQTQTQGFDAVLVRSLRRLVAEHGAASVLFADLDHLGDLNSEFGEARVDSVFGYIAAILEQAVGEVGLALHRSGDEFLCLYPGGGAEAIMLAERACLEVAAHDFGLGKALSISIGVATIDRHTNFSTFAEIESMAERALKPSETPGGVKIDKPEKARRGSVSLLPSPTSAQEAEAFGELSPEGEQALAVAVVKSSAGESSPFRDPWLNAISQRSLSLLTLYESWEERHDAMVDFLQWLSPSPAEGPTGAASLRVTLGPEPMLSAADIGLACAHGILRGALLDSPAMSEFTLDSELSVRYSDGSDFKVLTDDTELLAFGETCQHTISLGGLIRCHEGVSPAEVQPRRVLLVRIGHADVPAQEQLFADINTVDDRPTDGGGLPDFWEAAIARTVDRLIHYPDVTTVAVVGRRADEYLSVNRLLKSDEWEAESLQLAGRTGLSETVLDRASARLRGQVTVCADHDELVLLVAATVRAPVELHRLEPGALEEPEERFLDLRADMNPYELPPQSGCAVATGAQAYPLVLQLLRDAETEAAVPDAAGVPMIDLIDFRLLVREPERDQIPGFYARDLDDFEAYYERVFLDEQDGLFASRIREQLGRVVAHLAHAIDGPHPFSTRRAILVVDHPLMPVGEQVKEHDVAPLGLVSVRIIPRPEPGGFGLYMSFTWRTVEALVGLPYSLYGSLRYSQHLTDLVRARLGGGREAEIVQLRDVSYIAHSLHVTTDSYGQNIARRIIHLAGR